MTESAQSQYQSYDGIWFNDILLTGTSDTQRVQAWDFRRSFNLPSPGFTVRVIRENMTSKSLGMVGDSVGESIAAGGNSEFNRLIDGTFASTTISTQGGRCTTRVSCAGTSGVEEAALLPTGLDLVIVELGYNDNASTFAADIDAMMNALTARGVAQVAWVNMADIRTTSRGSTYGPMNAELSAAESRWSTLTVLDWNAASISGEARARWFADGVHLTTTGQAEFSLWLREETLNLTPSHFLAPPKKLRIPVVGRETEDSDRQPNHRPIDGISGCTQCHQCQHIGQRLRHRLALRDRTAPHGKPQHVSQHDHWQQCDCSDRFGRDNLPLVKRWNDLVVDVTGWFDDPDHPRPTNR